MGKFFKIGCIGLVVILLLFIALIMFSGSDEDPEVTVTDNPDSQTETTSSETEPAEEKPAESAVGSRSNPVPLGSTATITGNIYDEDSNSFDATIDITIKEVKRGQEVFDTLVAENEFNEAPAEGFEYMMVTAEATVKDAGTDDFAYLFSGSDFDFISSDGQTYEMVSVVTPNELFEELYNGGTASGNFVGQVKTGENVILGYEDGEFKNIFFATQ